MTDYKAMYYYLAGRMASAIEALDATTGALNQISEKMKESQRTTEALFLDGEETAMEIIQKQADSL